ncbi:uncharacterized protein LOC134190912 [Corticium candelabrum]|uniref:uncharacterized protein LOC134190912 n=1 Tax=Corticium candelabrum TaxID=121492 RepID=UPI002E260D83|nr:uncharacterized protein LOC134190912 [Corticium candelabrum]
MASLLVANRKSLGGSCFPIPINLSVETQQVSLELKRVLSKQMKMFYHTIALHKPMFGPMCTDKSRVVRLSRDQFAVPIAGASWGLRARTRSHFVPRNEQVGASMPMTSTNAYSRLNSGPRGRQGLRNKYVDVLNAGVSGGLSSHSSIAPLPSQPYSGTLFVPQSQTIQQATRLHNSLPMVQIKLHSQVMDRCHTYTSDRQLPVSHQHHIYSKYPVYTTTVNQQEGCHQREC